MKIHQFRCELKRSRLSVFFLSHHGPSTLLYFSVLWMLISSQIASGQYKDYLHSWGLGDLLFHFNCQHFFHCPSKYKKRTVSKMKHFPRRTRRLEQVWLCIPSWAAGSRGSPCPPVKKATRTNRLNQHGPTGPYTTFITTLNGSCDNF